MSEIILPSGMTVELKEITGEIELILEDKKLREDGNTFNKFMAACLFSIKGEELTTPQEAMKSVLEMKIGDRYFLLLAIRREIYGDEMIFNSECPHCKKTRGYQVNFEQMLQSGDLAIREFQPEPIIVPLGKSGGEATIKYATGEDEKRFVKEKILGAPTISYITLRTYLLNGKPPTVKNMAVLPIQDYNDIRLAVCELDESGGLDPRIELECDNCGNNYKIMFFGVPDFFMPTRKNLVA